MSRDLDIDFPMGDPSALYCRHCQRRRVERNGGLFCRVCDGNALELATRAGGEEA